LYIEMKRQREQDEAGSPTIDEDRCTKPKKVPSRVCVGCTTKRAYFPDKTGHSYKYCKPCAKERGLPAVRNPCKNCHLVCGTHDNEHGVKYQYCTNNNNENENKEKSESVFGQEWWKTEALKGWSRYFDTGPFKVLPCYFCTSYKGSLMGLLDHSLAKRHEWLTLL